MKTYSPKIQALAMIGLVADTIIWGASFSLVKWTITEIDAYYFLFLRFLVAFLFLAIIFRKRILKAKKSEITASLNLSIYLSIGYLAQTEGLKYTTAGNSAFITGLYIILIPLLSALSKKGREEITRPAIIGVMISFFGLYLLTYHGVQGINVGDYITLICAFAFSWHIILTKRMAHRHDIVPIVMFQLFFAALMFGILSFIKGVPSLHLSKIAVITIIITGIFATSLAFLIQTTAQRMISPTRAGIIFGMEAVFGALFGWWWGGEIMTKLAFIGACFIMSGVILTEMPLIFSIAKSRMIKYLRSES